MGWFSFADPLKYSCRSTVIGIHPTATGSSGLIAQTSVSPTVVAVTSHARQRWQIEAPKPRASQVVDRWQSGHFRWRGWSENDAGDVRSRTQLEVCPNSGEIVDGKNEPWPLVFELKSPAFWSVSGDEDGMDTLLVSQASNRYQARPVRWLESGDTIGSRSRVSGSDPGQRVISISLSLACSFLSLLFKNSFPQIQL